MSALIISYHHISSVTVSSSNRHAVCAGCLQSRHAFLDTLTLKDGTHWISQNIRTQLPLYDAYNPRREQISKHV